MIRTIQTLLLALFILTANILINKAFAYTNCQRPNWERNILIKEEGCHNNTRHFLLYKTSLIKATVNNRCYVVKGKWKSFYSDKIITEPQQIEIDHLMPWAELKRRGVCDRTTQEIKKIFNDIDNLIIASKKENRLKSDLLQPPFMITQEKTKEIYQRQCDFLKKYHFKVDDLCS